MKYTLTLILSVLLFGSVAQARQLGVFGGFNSTEFDSSASWDRELGFEGGMTAHFDVNSEFIFRTGAGFVQKNSSTTLFGTTTDIEFLYLEIPVTVLYYFNDMVGMIGGLNFDFKFTDDCSRAGSNCTVTDPESLVFNLVLGAHIKFNENSRFEPLLEIVGLSDVARDTKISNSLSFRYVYMF